MSLTQLIKKFSSSNPINYKAIKSALYSATGMASAQAIRLLSNLILTRLLAPEMFGVMAIAYLFIFGAKMFSDLGIELAIIQSKDGDKEDFLNSAWTLQIIRGLAICLIICIASYPTSVLYSQPELFNILLLISLIPLLEGFYSTSIALASKNLKLGKATLISVFSQVIGNSSMIIWAMISPTIWALVFGGIIGTLANLFFSFVYLDSHVHKIKLEKKYTKSIITYGKWIFITSIITFLSLQLDKILLGKLVGMEMLGIFTIAYTIAQLPIVLYNTISYKVLLPLYSNYQNITYEEMKANTYKMRLLINYSLLPISLTFMLYGDVIVNFLYDARYSNAGWILQIISLGMALEMSVNAGPYLQARAKNNIYAYLNMVRVILLFISILVGYKYFSSDGAIIGITISTVIFLIIRAIVDNKYNMFLWRIDITSTTLICFIFYFTYY
jgi:O-antigen/teichoic acid export membrane protein